MFAKASSILFIRICSIAIMVIAAVHSFSSQRVLLEAWRVDHLGTIIVPITVDLLAIICTLAIHTEEADGRATATTVLIIAGVASSAANFIAGGTLGSKLVNVWCVIAYLLSEWVAAKVKSRRSVVVDAKRSAAAKKAAATRAANRAQKAQSQAKRKRVGVALEDNVVAITRRAAAS